MFILNATVMIKPHSKLATPIDATLVSTCKDTLEAFAKDFKVANIRNDLSDNIYI